MSGPSSDSTSKNPSHSTMPSVRSAPADAVSESLSVEQSIALAALSAGQTIRGAAEQACVSRNTVTRWIQCDPVFRAAYNAWRRELTESTRATILNCAESAAAVVSKAIDNGDAKMGMALLKHLGLIAPQPVGLTDPKLIGDEIAIEHQELRHALELRANFSGKMSLSPRAREWEEYKAREAAAAQREEPQG